MTLNEEQQAPRGDQAADFSDLKALFLNCTLESSPEFPHTEQLLKVSEEIMDAQGVTTEMIRAVDYRRPAGIGPDLCENGENGLKRDDWSALSGKVMGTNILVIGTPIWLGEESSACRRLIERLYAETGKLDEGKQSIHYGRAGGCVITGSEDGIKHCAMSILYALQLRDRTTSPQPGADWTGEAGRRPSRVETGSGGSARDLARLNTTFMIWKVLQMASFLKNAGDRPVQGNDRRAWVAGCRFDFPAPAPYRG